MYTKKLDSTKQRHEKWHNENIIIVLQLQTEETHQVTRNPFH